MSVDLRKKTLRPNFTKLSVPVSMARSFSDGSVIHYVGLFRILWMTSRFHIMQVVGQNQMYISSSLPDGGTGAKSAVSDCMLFLA